jgi:hypothetical protein
MDSERNEVTEDWVKGVVFLQEVERCQSARHWFGRASRGARQAAWADVAGATAVEDAGLVAAVVAAAVVEAVDAAEAAVGGFAETEACCATWRRLCRSGREDGCCGRGRCAAEVVAVVETINRAWRGMQAERMEAGAATATVTGQAMLLRRQMVLMSGRVIDEEYGS